METQPQQYLSGGKDTAGSLGGQGSTDNTISAIVLPSGQNGSEYDFGEYLLAPGILSKRLALASTPTATVLVARQIVDTPPVVQLGGPSTVNYTTSSAGGSPVYIGPSATITHAGSGNLASLTVAIANPEDEASEGFVVAGQTVKSGTASQSLASFPKITATFTAGVLTLTGIDSAGDYQSLLRSIEYEDTAPSPNTSPRTITVVANDAILASNTAATTITIKPSASAAVNPTGTAAVSASPAPNVATPVASKPSSASLADLVIGSVAAANTVSASKTTTTTTAIKPSASAAANPTGTAVVSASPAPNVTTPVASKPSRASLADLVIGSVNQWL